jgi:indole-3-glycerol phosphate synthase
VLDSLFKASFEAALAREQQVPFSELHEIVAALTPAVDAYSVLARSNRIKLIAEIKRASPSRGFLAEIHEPALLARDYEHFGAHAISVLTEGTGFGGSLDDLIAVSKEVSIPTLRKDFISTEYQILEARAAGAAFILLILSHLSKSEAQKLLDFTHQVGMAALVETHSEAEIDASLEIGSKLIGINTRDLKTFKTDNSLFEKLALRLPNDVVRVAESSVKSVDDVKRYRDAGADVVLVGEALVTGDYQKLIPEFVSVA